MANKKRLSYTSILIMLIFVLILSLVPLLAEARYNVPSADDYSYGVRAHKAYTESGSLIAAVRAAIEEARGAYYSWQGSFSAIFMMALQPAVFGEQYYSLGTWLLLGTLVAGCFALCIALFSGIFGIEKRAGAIVGAVLSVACIQLVPHPVQAFFWYNGSVYYTFFFGLSLLALALGIHTVKKGGVWQQILLSLTAFFIGGGNYVTALSTSIIAVFSILLLLIIKNRAFKRLIVPTALLLIAFFISADAPGNAVRQSEVAGVDPNAVKAVLDSFAYGAEYIVRFMRLPLVGALIFLLPIFRRGAAHTAFDFKYPWLVTLFSYCFMSAMFCPTAYALDSVGESRLTNIIFYAYVLLLMINLFYWIGWFVRRRNRGSDEKNIAALPIRELLPVFALCLTLCLLGSNYSSAHALKSLYTGEAAAYYRCAQERFEILKDENITDAKLYGFPCQPYLLYFDDITTDSSDWRNLSVSSYYGKNTVVLVTEG